MTYFYTDSEPQRAGAPIPYHKQNANRRWKEHYANMLMLEFFSSHEVDPMARRQAAKETTICQRKLDYWQKHINFDQATANKDAMELKGQWQQPRQALKA